MRQHARLLGLMLLVLALVGYLGPDARAAERAQLFASFATENFNEIDNAVSALAASGDEKAQTLLSALADRRLFYSPADKQIVLKEESGKSFDALTGAALAAFPGGLKPVRINNRVRATIDAALGSLTLMAADPAKRREAAETEFKSRNATSLGTIETALAKETDPTVKRAMQEARAALVISKTDATQEERLDAVKTIRERGDQDALSLLRSVGTDAPTAVKSAADAASAAVESRLALWAIVQNAWYGLSLGSVLLLAAIGLAVTFGVMGVINMAHGEMVMLGAYTSFAI